MRSVGFKYFITFILCATLVLVMVFSFSREALDDYSEQQRATLTGNISSSASEYLSDKLYRYQVMSVSQLLEEDRTNIKMTLEALASSSEGVFIILCNTDGSVCAYVDAPSGYSENTNITLPKSFTDNFIHTSKNSFVFEKGIEGLTSSRTEAYVSTINDKAMSVYGHVIVCTTVTGDDTFVSQVTQRVVIAFIWFFLIGVLLYYALTYRTSRDLKLISDCAGKFAEGDFSPRVHLRRSDEISDLADAFNNMADSLKNHDDSRNNFIASVSHDLRTPMTTIKGLIECIIAGAIPQSEVNSTLLNVTEEINRLNRLVNAMLDVTRLQSGKRQFNMKEFDICELIRLVMISLEPEGAKKEIDAELDIEGDADSLPVIGDKDSIHQVLYNIVQNAIKFSNNGGLIKISVRDETPEEIREREDSFDLVPKRIISVYNEGIGISKEMKAFVFDRFFKADSTRQMDKQGVGLGMYIAKTILDAHDQHITVDSEEGSWCKFSFTLDKPTASQKSSSTEN